jgi:hypothetical protein
MKQKDIALIIVIVAIAAFISFFVSRLLFQSGDKRAQKAEVVDVISTDFELPSTKYFNDKSIDPTQLITIGGSNNQNPFNSKNQ